MSDYSELKRLAQEVNDDFPLKEDLWNMVCTPSVAMHLVADIEKLKAENETLVAAAAALRDEWRKDQADAERYRWLRDPDNQEDLEPDSDYLMPPIICGYAEHEDILSMESLDKAIDDAMGSGDQP
ncbi:hypothetical protein [Pseudomonas sp. WMBT8]|uniref:hypothetical protein n=1 Tax=Pseudomonas sp. WMBT8 TaxID=3414496 RepID=UPI003D805C97